MKNLRLSIPAILSALSLLAACNTNTPTQQQQKAESTKATRQLSVPGNIMTEEAQNKLTPDQVLRDLKDGNAWFQRNNKITRDYSERERMEALGQFPKAIVLSCIDSRIPIEDVLDQGLGDIFVGRVAGNTVNEDMLGSMEYACKVARAKLILVVGHEHCGAIESAIKKVKLGNITAMLMRVKPAIKMSQNFKGDKTAENASYVKVVSENNVRNSINTIRAKSPILREMETKGEIKIAGAYYNLANGQLEFIE